MQDLRKQSCDLSARNPSRTNDYEHRPALELVESIKVKEIRVLELLGELEDLLQERP